MEKFLGVIDFMMSLDKHVFVDLLQTLWISDASLKKEVDNLIERCERECIRDLVIENTRKGGILLRFMNVICRRLPQKSWFIGYLEKFLVFSMKWQNVEEYSKTTRSIKASLNIHFQEQGKQIIAWVNDRHLGTDDSATLYELLTESGKEKIKLHSEGYSSYLDSNTTTEKVFVSVVSQTGEEDPKFYIRNDSTFESVLDVSESGKYIRQTLDKDFREYIEIKDFKEYRTRDRCVNNYLRSIGLCWRFCYLATKIWQTTFYKGEKCYSCLVSVPAGTDIVGFKAVDPLTFAQTPVEQAR